MTREQLWDIIGDIDDRFIAEAAQYDPKKCSRSPERIRVMSKKRIITFALSAALLLGLGAAAYAGGWFDRKQVVIVEPLVTQNSETEEIEIVGDESDEVQRVLTPSVPEEVRRVSVTQALVVPDDLDPETYARASNSVAATNELLAWENGLEPAPEEPTEILNKRAEQGWDALTDEEKQIIRDYSKELAEYSQQISEEENQFKRQIMEKYGLRERHMLEPENCLLSWETCEKGDMAHFGEIRNDYRSNENNLSNRELADWISDNYCRGDYFTSVPDGFDKVYWLPESDFCVSYYLISSRRITPPPVEITQPVCCAASATISLSRSRKAASPCVRMISEGCMPAFCSIS